MGMSPPVVHMSVSLHVCVADLSRKWFLAAYFLQYVGVRLVFRVCCTVHDVRENLGPISPSEVVSLHSSAGTLQCAGSQNAPFSVSLVACHWFITTEPTYHIEFLARRYSSDLEVYMSAF